MFSVESYLTPYIAAYLGKYVDNFNKSNFQVSLWDGGATFQNVDLNLAAIEAELEIPFHVLSGHIHEMKISVPWTKITSEPIVITLNTFELSFGLKREEAAQVRRAPVEPTLPPDTTGYMQGLMNKIIQNAKVVCHNMILKYIEDDIVLSLNFEHVTLCSVNSCWEQAFVDVGGTDFIVRRRLICPDLTVCLDSRHSVSRHSYTEPLLYKCSFDVRILNQFQGPFSRVPFLRRLDILFNEADMSVSEEQIPMLIRLYNLGIALTQLKGPQYESYEPESVSTDGIPSTVPEVEPHPASTSSEQPVSPPAAEEPESDGYPGDVDVDDSLYSWATWAVGWIPFSNLVATEEEDPPPTPPHPIQPLLSLGLYVNTAHCSFKRAEPVSDRTSTTGSTPSSRIKTKPYLKANIQGVVFDIVVQGVSRSVRGGFCEFRLEGVGTCPCDLENCPAVEDRAMSPLHPGLASGMSYLTMGIARPGFIDGTLFDHQRPPTYESFDCRFHCKGYEVKYSEISMLERTPAVGFDSVEILPSHDAPPPEECCTNAMSSPLTGLRSPVDSDFKIAFEKEGPKTSTRLVVAPVNLRLSVGFIHRLKVVYRALRSYNYVPYTTILPLYIPELRFFLKLRLDLVHLRFSNGETEGPETSNELRLTLTNLKGNVDVKEFCKKNYFQFRSIELCSYKREGDSWLNSGLVFSTDSIEKEITVLKDFNDSSSTPGISTDHLNLLPDIHLTPFKLDRRVDQVEDIFLAFSYTDMDLTNYRGSTKTGMKLDEDRTLREVNLKVKSVDVILSPRTFIPFVYLVKEIVSLVTDERGTGQSDLGCPHAQVPLAYVRTERIRVFGLISDDNWAGENCLALEITGVQLTSQVEFGSESHSRSDLFSRDTGNTGYYGNSGERTYGVVVSSMTISTFLWDENEKMMVACPIFAQSPVPLILSAPRHGSSSILSDGYGAQLNFNKEIHLTANTSQIGLLSRIFYESSSLFRHYDSIQIFNPHGNLPEDQYPYPSSIPEWDEPTPEVDSGVESSTVWRPMNSPTDSVPLELFLTAPTIRITTYQLERPYDEVGFKVKPLLNVNLLKPYGSATISKGRQRANFSVVDVSAGIGRGIGQILPEFGIPKKTDFPMSILETIPGERDSKTGLFSPLLTVSAMDFLINQQVRLKCDIGRPLKFQLSQERLYLIQDIMGDVCEYMDLDSDLPPAVTELQESLNVHRLITLISKYTSRVDIYLKQVVCVVIEAPAGLPKAAVTTSVTGIEIGLSASDLSQGSLLVPSASKMSMAVETITITTLLGERTDLFLSPSGLRVRLSLEWHSFVDAPLMAINLNCDPIRFHLGPQNVLAFLQVYHTFGIYLRRLAAAEEKEFVELLQVPPDVTAFEELTFEDDFRHGVFHCVVASPPPSPLPVVYQVSISLEERTITWRYPNPRSIKAIRTHPVTRLNPVMEIECSLSCWDEVESGFVFVGSLVIKENVGEGVIFEGDDTVAHHVSALWRLTIQTPMDEEDLRFSLQPDGLLACLSITSSFSKQQVPKLLLVIHVPLVTLHLINNQTYAGKLPDRDLALFSLEGLQTQTDQPFGTLTLSPVAISLSVWVQRAKFESQMAIGLTVTDYAYLTDINVLDPTHLRMSYNLIEKNSQKVYQGFTLYSQGLRLKLSASALHTLMTSMQSWVQVLKSYYGDVVDTSKAHFQSSVNVARIVIANDTTTTLTVRQVQTKKGIVIQSRHANAFTWTTQKVKAEVILGLSESSKETVSFGIRSAGKVVRILGDTCLFLTTKTLYQSQLLVLISGGVTVGNGLEIPLDVGILSRRTSDEKSWTVEPRSHGPSLLMHPNEIGGVRFRLRNLNGRHHPGWSNSLTLEELYPLPNQSKSITLYEETNGELVEYNVWCTVIEESVDGGRRCLIFVSPIFRIVSFLPTPTRATVTHPQTLPTEIFLSGRGSEIEMDFKGVPTAAHLLTFHSESWGSLGSSPIPLVAGGGPCVETQSGKPPLIDTILENLEPSGGDGVGTVKQTQIPWPFTTDANKMDGRDWLQGPKTEGALKVTFKPWIPGIPSVVVEVKPEALLVNLTGQTLLFRQDGDDMSIFHRTAFSPSDIRMKFAFGLNLARIGGTGVIWSEELEMSQHPGPSQIHHVNSDWRIPINATSRLEINGPKQQIHLTIEAKLHEAIVVVTVRPTYNIQNKTDVELGVSGLSVIEEGIEVMGALEKSFVPISSSSKGASPLLLFTCDWEPSAGDIYMAGTKYLALKYGESPAWIVPLVKFEQIFDNISAPQGVPVNQVSAVVPITQPHWVSGSPSKPTQVTVPVSIAWTVKEGQVWISIQNDLRPRVVLTNSSRVGLCFGEGEKGVGRHGQESYLTQVPILGPYTTSFFTFPPGTPTETVVFAVYPLPPQNIMLTTFLCDPTMLQWSPPVKCEDTEDVQMILLGTGPRKVHLKVTVESLGPSYYIFVEELSDAEVSARDVRARIQSDSSGLLSLVHDKVSAELRSQPIPPVEPEIKPGINTQLGEDQLMVALIRSHAALMAAQPSDSMSEIDSEVGTRANPFVEIQAYFPLIRVILLDDVNEAGDRREILSLTLTDGFVERKCKHGDRPLRVLLNRPQEAWILRLLLGHVQVDNGLYQGKQYDFPVLLQRTDHYVGPACVTQLKDFQSAINYFFATSPPLVNFESEFLITSPEGIQTLQSVEVKCEPVTVNIEDKFLAYIVPFVRDLMAVVGQRLELLYTHTKILQRQSLERHSRESLEFLLSPPRRTKAGSLAVGLGTVDGTNEPTQVLVSRRTSWSEPITPVESPGMRTPSIPPLLLGVEVEVEVELEKSAFAHYVKKYVDSVQFNKGDSEDLEMGPALADIGDAILVPSEIQWILDDVAHPFHLRSIRFGQVQTYFTFRGTYAGVYFAFDNSPVLLNSFGATDLVTSRFRLGQTLASHFMMGAIYRAGNPMRILASLELIGSPGSLARSLGTGVKDFVIYPLRGVKGGPLAFVAGLNFGSTSLVKNFTAGTLTSVTNLAWSVSRNLDRWILDGAEEVLVEESRRQTIDGISDGLGKGLTSFGIRLLGAIGGVLHHPLQAVMDDGTTPYRIAKGVGKGLLGAVTKPVGATVELLAMTGQGLLQEAGWAHKFMRKEAVYVEKMDQSVNSLLKYHWKLGLTGRVQEKLLLLVEGIETGVRGRATQVSLLITTHNVIVMDTSLDQVRRRESIGSTVIQPRDFDLEECASKEVFTLLRLLKLMEGHDLFGIFPKTIG